MRRFVMVAFVAGLGIALCLCTAATARASTTIVVGPGQSIQAAIDAATPGDTVLLTPGVFHESVQIRTDGITLRGSGENDGGTVLEPPTSFPANLCNGAFGQTGVCVLAKDINTQTGAVITPVNNDTVTGILIKDFPANGVFGFGTTGLTVTKVTAIDDGNYGISRFASSATVFADDTAIGNNDAGFYVGNSPDASTVVSDDQASGNQFGIFIRHARGVFIAGNTVSGNCEGIMVLDDGQSGGVGDLNIAGNAITVNNRLCPAQPRFPVTLQGGGILLLGATNTVVAHNTVSGNSGTQINSGGIVIKSAKALTGGSDPASDTIVGNTASGNQPADLSWDGSGTGVTFVLNRCGTSIPAGLCY